MKIMPDIEHIHLRALVNKYGLQATIRALGVIASEKGAETQDARWEEAAKYLYNRASRAPSVQDL